MHIISYVNNDKQFTYGFETFNEVFNFIECLRSLNLTFTHFFQE